jgi:hypothetical protein
MSLPNLNDFQLYLAVGLPTISIAASRSSGIARGMARS